MQPRTFSFAVVTIAAALLWGRYDWYRYPNDTVQTGGGLMLRPRDMAKIGFLYLNGGRWGGQRVLCEDWIAESTKQQAPDAEYGYQWWLDRYLHLARPVARGFSASGRAGQYIFVLPEQSLVAVFTGNNDNERYLQPREIMSRYILPAAIRSLQ